VPGSGVGIAVGVPNPVTVVPPVDVVVVVALLQPVPMVLLSSVTVPPLSAMTLPHPIVALVWIASDDAPFEIIFPSNVEPVPMVALLPTAQYTLSVGTQPSSTT